jgi:DNA-binding MarR family transcriptional regulator
MSNQPEFMPMVENWAKLYFFQSLTDFFNYLKNTELSLLQAYALAYLYFKGPIKISELCEHMMVSPGAASQMVDRLEKLGMVSRIADPTDRRIRKVQVLTKGEKFVEENFAFSQSWLRQIPASISAEEQTLVADALSLLLQTLAKDHQTNQ